MHIHLPKPLHGWKAFFNEITVIVIGVLIALGLEAGVEYLHEQHKAKDGEERLKLELRTLAWYAAEHIVIAPCVQRQLDLMRDRVVASRDAIDPMPMIEDGVEASTLKMAHRSWATPTWEALQQDGTTNFLASRKQRLLGRIYQVAGSMATVGVTRPVRMARLSLLGLPIQLTPGIKADLLADIATEKYASRLGVAPAAQLIAALRLSGLGPSDAEIDVDLSRESGMSLGTIPWCRQQGLPLGDWRVVVAGVNPSYFD